MPEPMTSAARNAEPRYSASSRRARGARSATVEFVHELAHPPVDVVARGADLLDRAVLRVGQVPVLPELLPPGNGRTGVAAAHRDHRIGLRRQLARERLRLLGGDVEAELAQRRDDFRMRAAARHWLAAGGDRAVPAAGGALEQRLAHHAAAAVGLADEQHRGHQAGLRARMIAEVAWSCTRWVSRMSMSVRPAPVSAARNSASVSAPA